MSTSRLHHRLDRLRLHGKPSFDIYLSAALRHHARWVLLLDERYGEAFKFFLEKRRMEDHAARVLHAQETLANDRPELWAFDQLTIEAFHGGRAKARKASAIWGRSPDQMWRHWTACLKRRVRREAAQLDASAAAV